MAALAHLGVGLASRQTAPKIPAVFLIIAPLLLDLLGLVFYLLPIENSLRIVWSHSLGMAVIWSIVFGVIMLLIYRNWRSSIIIALLILSHWIIDFITWPMTAVYPDSTGVPIFFGMSLRIGLGLYRSLVGVVIFEAGVLILGIVLFVKSKSMEKEKGLSISK